MVATDSTRKTLFVAPTTVNQDTLYEYKKATDDQAAFEAMERIAEGIYRIE